MLRVTILFSPVTAPQFPDVQDLADKRLQDKPKHTEVYRGSLYTLYIYLKR